MGFLVSLNIAPYFIIFWAFLEMAEQTKSRAY